MSAWSAGMSYPPETVARTPLASSVVAPTRKRPSRMVNGICAAPTDSAPADSAGSTICYWARLKDDSGSNIIANNAGQGAARLTVKAGEYLQITGCDWTRA